APLPAPLAEEPAPVPAPLAEVDLTLEDWHEGHRLGLRNGGILVDRLVRATVGHHGCPGVADLESALIKVVRNVSAPQGQSDALVLGFYRGYLDAVRDGIRGAR